ncbi:hypothetical protein B4N89_24030 [Embleya scabrispora]|uniref:Uncharacterized protein n=1 Tax=Embleya scabrispora TaxID=159449 RepID=A0A1T3P3T3_9ACTN|nr:hypothetical protein [Embleya scabrispora]OPC83602.1 hypothetical protein B4N89_24030 [Embleya scabrispora]
MSTDAPASHPVTASLRGWLLPFAGATSAGWLIGTYAIRAAALGSCDDFGRRGCTGDDFGPSLIGLSGLLLLLALIAGAVAAGAGRRGIPAFAGALLYAGGIAALAALIEPATDAGWYIPTATTVALAVLLLTLAAFGAGERGRPVTAPIPKPAEPPAVPGESAAAPGNTPPLPGR